MALIVEDGTGKSDSNAYATRAEGDAYHADHLYSSVWDAAAGAGKDSALIMASRLLDENVRWRGRKAKRGQALEWPRVGVTDPDGFAIGSNAIPKFLKNAVAELARGLLAADRTAEDATKGFGRIKVGSLEIAPDRADRKDILPKAVLRMVAPYGLIAGAGQVRLTRV